MVSSKAVTNHPPTDFLGAKEKSNQPKTNTFPFRNVVFRIRFRTLLDVPVCEMKHADRDTLGEGARDSSQLV